jgi:adenylate cyclase
MSLITELQRRNVFRVTLAYAVIAWLLAQISDLAFDNFGAPDWVPKSVLFLLILGFPLAIFFAWAFEMTPEGVRKDTGVDRAQSNTDQTGRKLNFFIIAVLAVAVCFLLVDKFVLQEDLSLTDADSIIATVTDKSVAVLPFVTISRGPDDEYFADGLTEEILNSLAQLPDLLVTARTSAFSFKGLDMPIPEIAAKLGVAHVVEGSVRRAGERLRITAQLIRAHDGFQLWSETYERSGTDDFGLQVEIAERVGAALDIVLDEEQLAKMRSSGLRKPEAFIAYQKAVEAYNEAHKLSDQEQLVELLAANEFFERTLELEPDFSSAHFLHADYYVHFVFADKTVGGLADESVVEAIELAVTDYQNAARTAGTEGDRLNAMVQQALISGQWRRLPELLAAAIRSPDCISPAWWGRMLGSFAPSDEILALWQRALECDPLNFYNWANFAAIQVGVGKFEAAIDTATSGLQVVEHVQIAAELVTALIASGKFDQAFAASQRHIEDERVRDRIRLLLAAATGNAIDIERWHEERMENYGGESESISMLAVEGNREGANQLAAIEDAQSLGFLRLSNAVISCDCGAPFDLEATPNFARFVDEAGLRWPPAQPIKWPLKNW